MSDRRSGDDRQGRTRRRRMARQSRQAERGGAGPIPCRRDRGPARLPRCVRLALRRAHLVPMGRWWVLHHPARPLGVGQVHGRRRARLDLDRLARPPVRQGPDPGRGAGDRGAKRRRTLGRDRQRDVPALPRRGRSKVSGSHPQRAALALFRQAEADLLLARHRLGPPLQAQRMGDVDDRATLSPQTIEWNLPWGAALRGLQWGSGVDLALLLHEPGADLDAWLTLPGEIARQLEIETVAVDLPGHGLSDDPWDPARLPDLLRALPEIAPAEGRRFLIAAGTSAIAALEQAPVIELSGLMCLSPQRLDHEQNPPRSPRVPKLFIAGSLDGSDLGSARRLATTSGGWTVVTALPVAERGTALLASPWGGQLIEQAITFLRDCQHRPFPLSQSTGPATRHGVPFGPDS